MSLKSGKKACVLKKNNSLKTHQFAEDHVILTTSEHFFSRLLQQLVTNSVTSKIYVNLE